MYNMTGLYFGLNQKRFGGNHKIISNSITLGSTKGKGSSTRLAIFNNKQVTQTTTVTQSKDEIQTALNNALVMLNIEKNKALDEIINASILLNTTDLESVTTKLEFIFNQFYKKTSAEVILEFSN